MKTNKIIRTLAGINKGIFKALNLNYGFNFEKPFDVYEIKTPFTLNRIEKEIGSKHTPLYSNKSRVVVLFHYPNANGYRANRLYGVRVIGTGAGDFDITTNRDIHYPYYSIIDNFYAKYEFNEARKDSELKAYIIAQEVGNLAHIYKRPSEPQTWSERRPDLAGQNRRTWGGRTYAEYDKSGYRVSLKSDHLKNEARRLHIERAKTAFLATDNSAKINELKNRATMAKEVIKAHIDNAASREDFRKIERAVGSWSGLGDVFESITVLTTGEREKSFASMDEFNRYNDSATRIINKILAWEF